MTARPTDFTAMARDELVDLYDLPHTKGVAHLTELLAKAHAAGRAEALDEAALLVVAEPASASRQAAAIRALASDPVAGDQVAEAPGLAAQEIERLRAIETAARALRERVHSEETMRAWDRWRRAVETMPGASLPRDAFENWLFDLTSKLDVALSVPRPAPKGPKE